MDLTSAYNMFIAEQDGQKRFELFRTFPKEIQESLMDGETDGWSDEIMSDFDKRCRDNNFMVPELIYSKESDSDESDIGSEISYKSLLDKYHKKRGKCMSLKAQLKKGNIKE